MKLATWNLNGIRAIARKNPEALFLNCDVLCLQEIRAETIIAEQICEDIGITKYFPYRKYTQSQRKGYAGTAIWSKQPFTPIPIISPCLKVQQALNEGRICAAIIKGYSVFSIYSPNTVHREGRLKYRTEVWEPFLLSLVASYPNLILAGDLNVAPLNKDLAEPIANRNTPGATILEKLAFKNLTKNLFDNYRLHHPNQQSYTWWNYRGQKRKYNLGWRIDHILSSQKSNKCDILDTVPGSDHCPCIANF
jgi:exodeoxyribonuclease III